MLTPQQRYDREKAKLDARRDILTARLDRIEREYATAHQALTLRISDMDARIRAIRQK